jgi:type I restriction enzyme R subunit
VVFEIELIKQVEINVDYILMLVERYIQAKGTGEDKEIRATIERAVKFQPVPAQQEGPHRAVRGFRFRDGRVDAQWQAFVAGRRPRNWSGSLPTRI